MVKEKKANLLLEEKEGISKEEISSKIKRLQGYIVKTESRIKMHEKALAKLREKMEKEIKKTMRGILGEKIYG